MDYGKAKLPRLGRWAVDRAGGLAVVDAGHSIDPFTGPAMWAIHLAVRMVPTLTLHRLMGRGPNESSMWLKLRHKVPQGYVVARKKGS